MLHSIARGMAGACLAISIALLAWRGRTLDVSGAVTAAIVGTVTILAGWDWGALLLVFFVAGTGLSRLGVGVKAARTASIVDKGIRRDGWQVLANGGAFVVAASAWLMSPSLVARAAGAGALAAAAADTFATEIGTLSHEQPRMLVSGRRVPPGTSGAVTALGSAAALAGAAMIALAAWLLGWSPAIAWAAFVGGVGGTAADTVLGATLQARRHCPRCDASTERRRHSCGEQTQAAGGLPWCDNDAVNALATTAGGLLAALAVR